MKTTAEEKGEQEQAAFTCIGGCLTLVFLAGAVILTIHVAGNRPLASMWDSVRKLGRKGEDLASRAASEGRPPVIPERELRDAGDAAASGASGFVDIVMVVLAWVGFLFLLAMTLLGPKRLRELQKGG